MKDDQEAKKEYFYFDENALNYDFSDFVKINSFPRGLLFSFGKFCPDKKQYGIFKEILLPFEVANALSNIIQEHLKKLEELKLIENIPIETAKKEGEKK